MQWWGKFLGGAIGLLTGGPIGAALGVAAGHALDFSVADADDSEGLRRRHSAFFSATFSTMGQVAKADGRVSEREIAVAEAVMNQLGLTPDMRRKAIGLFNEGKSADFPLDRVLEEFLRECRGRLSLIQVFLEVQLQIAFVDGEPAGMKRRLLDDLRRRLGIPELLFRRIEDTARVRMQGGTAQSTARGRSRSLREAYALLGVDPKAPDAVVKRAYRRMLSQHHPDKLASKGLPEDMLELATAKTHEIRQAYELIVRERAAA